MTSLESFVEAYGTLAVVLGTFFEGETILVLAGLAAHRGYLSLPSVVAAGFLGSFLGDLLYFYLGRRHGEAFLAKRPGWLVRTARAQRVLERHHVAFILGFRFLYGLRTVSPFVIGLSAVPAGRYAVLNLLGALVWSAAVAFLGYSLGEAAELLIERVKEVEKWLFLGIVLAGSVVWLAYFLRSRHQGSRSEGP